MAHAINIISSASPPYFQYYRDSRLRLCLVCADVAIIPRIQSQTPRRVSTPNRRTSFASFPTKRDPKLPGVSSICPDLIRPGHPILRY